MMNPTADKQDPAELIPWYINGTLTQEEAAMVEVYLEQGGEEARAELDLQRAIQASELGQPSGNTPGEFGWKRLQRDLHRSAEQAQSPGKSTSWLRPAMAAAVAVIVIQSALLGSFWTSDPERGLQPLSGNAHPAAALQVKFNSQATEIQIRTLLREVEVVLVDGPSAAGIYRLQLIDGSTTDRLSVMQKLQAANSVIEHVAEEQ